MRLYIEGFMSFNKLYARWPEDAILNRERLFENKLEALHSFWDLTKDWNYASSTACTILLQVRNAIHHREHSLFYSIAYKHYKATLPVGTYFFARIGLDLEDADSPYLVRHMVQLSDLMDWLEFDKNKLPSNLIKKFKEDWTKLTLEIKTNIKGKKPAENFLYLDLAFLFMIVMSDISKEYSEKGLSPLSNDSSVYLDHFHQQEFVTTKISIIKQVNNP